MQPPPQPAVHAIDASILASLNALGARAAPDL